jgi:hypothetical protein
MFYDLADPHAFLELGLLAKSKLPSEVSEELFFSLILNSWLAAAEEEHSTETLIAPTTMGTLEKVLTIRLHRYFD